MPTSALTGVTLKDMFDAGLHFGHQTKRWNPKMKAYIFDKRNGIHIIDLTQSVQLLDEAAEFLRQTVLDGKKVLFVATKKQAAELVKDTAASVDQFYVTERWLGGTLTNAKTIRSSVKRMRQLQATAKANGGGGFSLDDLGLTLGGEIGLGLVLGGFLGGASGGLDVGGDAGLLGG
ncbi:MAG: 30S ribosomal protein S2, partial [Kiritimatiellae bacterium]|nr:30S ribosomal protein S2 [Kiritimatiellia bacterium]